jgi:hypothetical protein
MALYKILFELYRQLIVVIVAGVFVGKGYDMCRGPFAPIYPLLGDICSFYVFEHFGMWRAVVFESRRSVRYLIVYGWKGTFWKLLRKFWNRGVVLRVASIRPRQAPIVDVYVSLTDGSEQPIAVVEHNWIVVYKHLQTGEGWSVVVEYLLP